MNINATLIGQSFSFLFFAIFCMKYVWPPIIKALNDRQKKIADSIEIAHQADNKLVKAKKIAASTIDNANTQANEIIARAKKDAKAIINTAKQNAIKEAKTIVDEATNEVEQQYEQAKTDLRRKLADLIYLGTEKLIGENFKTPANTKYIKQMSNNF